MKQLRKLSKAQRIYLHELELYNRVTSKRQKQDGRTNGYRSDEGEGEG